ncbi:MAG: DUF4293 domain-containing protein [Clostridiales bacterium]|nr:DUF4293 domain-containing protein [Clostridiales bacterium]
MIDFGSLTGALFFVSLLGYALVCMSIFPKLKAGHALLSACAGMLFVSFYGVIALQLMIPTAYLLMIGGLFCFIGGMVGAMMNKRNLRSRVLSSGMLIYVLGSIAFALLSTHLRVSADHDALSYWARIVKELFTYDRFPIHANTTMYHSDYIPLFASLQYCIVKVFGWQDPYLSYVTFACMLTSACGIADHVRSKLWGLVAGGMSLYAIRLFGATYFTFGNIRADAPMVMLFTAAALCLIAEDDEPVNSWLPALLVASIIVGTKIYSGLMFSIVLAGIMLYKTIRSRKTLQKPNARKLLRISLAALALVLLMQLCWSGLYNYHSALASYESNQAAALMHSLPFDQERPAFTLRYLFSGNPRTSELSSSLTPEKFRLVAGLIGSTWTAYTQSKLPYVWFFVLALIVLIFISAKKERRHITMTLASFLIMALIYVLGLFASYFVQAETSGAATTYLITASTPLMIAGLFYAVRAIAAKERKVQIAGLGLLGALFICMYPITTPGMILNKLVNDRDARPKMNIAENFYTNMIDDDITADDSGKLALLLECSEDASYIGSSSFKTHAYQYYGMPLRVHVFQYAYGDHLASETVNGEYILSTLDERRCELLLLRVEDEEYFSAFAAALGLAPDDDPIGVYDIVRQSGKLSLVCRKRTVEQE